MTASADRVRRHTAADVLRRIDDDTIATLTTCAESPERAQRRLADLDREWDVDRVLEIEAASMGLLGLALGTFAHTRLFALPVVVASAVLAQAVTGRYPLMPVFRRLGFRTAREIAREKYALKSLRGDFASMGTGEAAEAASPGERVPDNRGADSRPGLH
jgi:hypothetical protein